MVHATTRAGGFAVILFATMAIGSLSSAMGAATSAPNGGTNSPQAEVSWPAPAFLEDGGWPKAAPDDVGLSCPQVDAYLSWLTAKAGGEPFGTIVVRHGRIAIEHYGSGGTSSSTWEIGSIRKAVGSALLGMALEEGKLTLETPAHRLWPQILNQGNQEKDKAIQVKHLFNSTSGWKRPEVPGTKWVYSNAAFTAGQVLLGRVYGLAGDRIAPLAQSCVAEAIGASSWRCYHYPESFTASYRNPGPKLAVDSTLRDLARFGYLWLRQGEWNGRQILPAGYVHEATRNQASAAGGHYGFCWFINDGRKLLPAAPEDAYFHVGNGKENRRTVLAIVPSLDLVAVVGTHAAKFDITQGYTSVPVPHVNEWIGKIVACIQADEGKDFAFPAATPGQVGMDGAKLEKAREYALTGGGSGCIIRSGRLVMAWGDQKQKYDIYSSTKSVGVTALGLAIMDGKVQLHDKAKKHLPSVGTPPQSNAQSGWLDELTLWHLATQTGGFEKTRGWCRQVHQPGTTWIYSDGGPNWLADCLTVAYGHDLQDVMNERVFAPLGITIGETPRGGEHDLHWGFNNLDRPHQLNGINRRPFGAGIHSNVEAMAKIGYLYLRRGRWQGKQIVPEDFVDLVRRSDPRVNKLPVGSDEEGSRPGASKHYGLLWWNNADGAIEGVPRDAYWSWGLKESFIIVIPSLDVVAVRAGDYWAPRDDPKRIDSHNNILKPFLLPICESVGRRGPYPQSACIPRVTFSDLILDKNVTGPDYASGDQWAGTWADDGHLYIGWGDGTGFGHRGNWRDPATTFMGLARLEGTPPNHRGVNVWGGYKPESQTGALYVNQDPQPINLKPADGLISINGVMYWYAERKSDGRVDCQLLTSADYGRTWRDHGRFFQEDGKFAFTGIIQFGQDYSDVPGYLGDYLYMFDGGTKAESNPHYARTDMLLARIPLNDLLNRRAVEFFDGTPGNPSWASDINQARAIFEDPQGVNAHVSCTYDKAIDRYLLLTTHSHGGKKKGFGLFEAERPWGPWSTVYYTDKLDDFVPGLKELISASLPSKWIAPDGRSMWLVFAGRPSDPFYSFNLIKVNLDVSQ